MLNPGTIAKALVAALVAGGGSYTVALQDGILSNVELVNVLVVAVVAGLTVFTVPNDTPSTPEHDDTTGATDGTSL